MDAVNRKPFFKPPRQSEKIRRRQKRVTREAGEKQNKDVVRSRDNRLRRGCSMPLCGCKKFRLAKHVAHLAHKGMGGNPKEDRSLPELMIQVCVARHREHKIAIDKGTLQCRPLTDAGTDGPVAWWVSIEDLMNPNVDFDAFGADSDGWIELARETMPGHFEVFTDQQREILEFLADMEF